MGEVVRYSTLSAISLDGVDLILLDLDNTLYEYDSCHQAALSVCVNYLMGVTQLSNNEIRQCYQESRAIVHHQLINTAASHSRLFYFQLLLEKIQGRTSFNETHKVYELYWNTYINEMKLFEDVLPFLEKVRSVNIPIVLVTDMIADIQFRKIAKLHLGEYLQFMVSSEEVGVEKPNAKIFEYAIEKAKLLGISINKVIMIGDSEKKDVLHNDTIAHDSVSYIKI